MQDGVVQIEWPDLRDIEGARTGASMFDVVSGPQCGEALARDAEFADDLHKFTVGRVRAEHGSHKGDHPGREPLPVTVEDAHFGLEKRRAKDVFAWREKA